MNALITFRVAAHNTEFFSQEFYPPFTSEGEDPSCDIYNMIPNDELKFPENIIIKSKLELSHQILACLEIMLLHDNISENDTYNLPFAVIGKIKGKIMNKTVNVSMLLASTNESVIIPVSYSIEYENENVINYNCKIESEQNKIPE